MGRNNTQTYKNKGARKHSDKKKKNIYFVLNGGVSLNEEKNKRLFFSQLILFLLFCIIITMLYIYFKDAKTSEYSPFSSSSSRCVYLMEDQIKSFEYHLKRYRKNTRTKFLSLNKIFYDKSYRIVTVVCTVWDKTWIFFSVPLQNVRFCYYIHYTYKDLITQASIHPDIPLYFSSSIIQKSLILLILHVTLKIISDGCVSDDGDTMTIILNINFIFQLATQCMQGYQ